MVEEFTVDDLLKMGWYHRGKSYNLGRTNIYFLSNPVVSLTTIWASNEKVITQLNNAYDVSRLEFSLLRLKLS